MKMQVISLILLFSLQNNFLMSMDKQPSAPPATSRLMSASTGPSYNPECDAGILQGSNVVGTVAPLRNDEGEVFAAGKNAFAHQNIGKNSAYTAYLFDKVTGLFSSVGVLQGGQVYEFNSSKNQLKQISRKNKIESCCEIVAGLGGAISGFAKENIVLQFLGCIGCARSVSCLVWAFGNPALTPQYIAWYLTVALCSSALSRGSELRSLKSTESTLLACLSGTIVGMVYRNS
jgi:hypothetical protein